MAHIAERPKFDAETVITDFLGDLADGHPRVGTLNSDTKMDRLRWLARCLISDLKENDLDIVIVTI